MSDTNPEYSPSIHAGGLRPATLLPYTDDGYSEPTWEDVRALMRIAQLTGSGAGDLAGVSARKVRRWACPPDSNDHLPIPYAVWRLLLLETGLVTLN